MIRCDDADQLQRHTPPRRLMDGGMINKPLVCADGRWLMAPSTFDHLSICGKHMGSVPQTMVYQSLDEGETFVPLGVVEMPERDLMVERGNSLWFLTRTSYGIGQSESHDGGRTWTRGQASGIDGPSARFHLRRLASGRILLINHFAFRNPTYERFLTDRGDANRFLIHWHMHRSNLTALLSEDGGHMWAYKLLLDDRQLVSYPDCTQAPDGRLHIIHDYDRHGRAQIVYSSITEEDILAGRLVDNRSCLKVVTNCLRGPLA